MDCTFSQELCAVQDTSTFHTDSFGCVKSNKSYLQLDQRRPVVRWPTALAPKRPAETARIHEILRERSAIYQKLFGHASTNNATAIRIIKQTGNARYDNVTMRTRL